MTLGSGLTRLSGVVVVRLTETLPLVSDIARGYKMFRITFLKFPGRNRVSLPNPGVSRVNHGRACRVRCGLIERHGRRDVGCER